MKRFVMAILILTLFLAGAVFSLIITKKESDKIMQSLSELQEICEQGESGAYEAALLVVEEWEYYRTKIGLLVHSEKLLDIQGKITMLPGLIKKDSDEIIASIDSICSDISWIYKREIPVIDNIL